MPKGAEFENPRKKIRELGLKGMPTTWKDGTVYLPAQPPRKISFLKDSPVEDYQLIGRINLLLQRISMLENRVGRLEGQLRKRKEK